MHEAQAARLIAHEVNARRTLRLFDRRKPVVARHGLRRLPVVRLAKGIYQEIGEGFSAVIIGIDRRFFDGIPLLITRVLLALSQLP